jgi:Na+/melibiose symporter-like transporter
VFHAAVPRILAGIVVGYLPIFFIDEVWSLAAQSWRTLAVIVALLGATTLLYLYIEVQRRLGESPRRSRARVRSSCSACSRPPASACCSRA